MAIKPRLAKLERQRRARRKGEVDVRYLADAELDRLIAGAGLPVPDVAKLSDAELDTLIGEVGER